MSKSSAMLLLICKRGRRCFYCCFSVKLDTEITFNSIAHLSVLYPEIALKLYIADFADMRDWTGSSNARLTLASWLIVFLMASRYQTSYLLHFEPFNVSLADIRNICTRLDVICQRDS